MTVLRAHNRPQVEEYGVDVSPGSLTSISLQMVASSLIDLCLINIDTVVQKAPDSCLRPNNPPRQVNITRHSYSNCSSSSWQRADTTYSYSVTGCQRFCVQRAVEVKPSNQATSFLLLATQEECGCSHPLLESGDLQPCILTGKGEESQCVLG